MRAGHGGPRRGAGRKPGRRPVVHHVRRVAHRDGGAAIITIRVRQDVPSLRCKRFVKAMQASFAECCDRGDFRLVQYSIQRDHLHLIAEADDQQAMGRGMKAVSARIARTVHRIFGRSGKVMAGRYHIRWLATPTEVWRAIRYVLLSARKHFKSRRGVAPPVVLDEASSGRWFLGWRGGTRGSRDGPREVAAAKTWLLRSGWKRLGLIDPAAVPGAG